MKKEVMILFLLVILIISGIGGYFYFIFSSDKPIQLKGDEILEVKVTMNNGVPLDKIEVDLWKVDSVGPPNAGFNFTNNEGIVIFNIPAGEYEIGFNLNNFPDNLVYPKKTFVVVEKDFPTYITILIDAK
jgi:hypothetical protein